jgi:tRNA pseudouridine38-40 synthase
MPRYFLTLSYNGTPYNGWQRQENTPNTVQQVMDEKLSMILQEKIELLGCGRTDTGVHAKDFIAHFDANCKDLLSNKKQWIYKFNNVLPVEISVQDIQGVLYTAHARFSATQRVYHYHIHQQKNPFVSDFSYYVYGDIDFELMNKAAELLLGTQDFTSFSKLHAQTKTNVCTVTKAVWQKTNVYQWRFTISADRFLRGMVRGVVGTLLLVGRNKITIEGFKNIIELKDRKLAGSNVPPHALFLVGINYPKEIFSE